MKATDSAPAWNARPMLATVATEATVPSGPGWCYEFKWDGVRALVRIAPGDGGIQIASRSGADITTTYPEVVELAQRLLDASAGRALRLDGEVVAFGPDGRPSFETLQGRMAVREPARVRRLASQIPVAFMAFDILVHDDRSVMALPYAERRALLETLSLELPPSLCYPDVNAAQMIAIAREQGLEGIVAKQSDRPYEPGRRSPSWVKVALRTRQDVVIGGWEPGQQGRAGQLGALLVGVYDDCGQLGYAGQVGSGFSGATLRDLQGRLAALETPTSPFVDTGVLTPREIREAHWVRPELVASVDFRNWTAEGRLRAPSFKGLRPDISPEAVVRDT